VRPGRSIKRRDYAETTLLWGRCSGCGYTWQWNGATENAYAAHRLIADHSACRCDWEQLSEGYRQAFHTTAAPIVDAVLAVADEHACRPGADAAARGGNVGRMRDPYANDSRGIPPEPPSDARGSNVTACGDGEVVREGREPAGRTEAPVEPSPCGTAGVHEHTYRRGGQVVHVPVGVRGIVEVSEAALHNLLTDAGFTREDEPA
jgi:hypothetical protein